jgi:hypothetical protein
MRLALCARREEIFGTCRDGPIVALVVRVAGLFISMPRHGSAELFLLSDGSLTSPSANRRWVRTTVAGPSGPVATAEISARRCWQSARLRGEPGL